MQGAKGDKGDAGQDGTARAFGRVFGTICSGSPTAFCQIDNTSKGVVYAAHVGTGIYCVGVSGIGPLSGAAIVSSSGDAPFVTWSANIACSTTEFEVRTYNASHTLSDQWFVITIP